MHDPTKEHLQAALRILMYLKKAPEQGLHFRRNIERTQIFTNVDSARLRIDMRSTTRYGTYLWMTWSSVEAKKNVVFRISAEA